MPIQDYHDQDSFKNYQDPAAMYDLDRSGYGVAAPPPQGPPTAFIYLGIFIIVAGVSAFSALLLYTIFTVNEGSAKLVAPGEVTVNFDQPGSYSVFYQYEGEAGGQWYSTSRRFPGLDCSLTGEAGREVNLNRTSGNSSFKSGREISVDLYKFEITEPGAYRFHAAYSEGETGPEVVLVIGKDMVGKVLWGVFGCLGILLGSLGVGLPLIIITAVKRSKAAAANQREDFGEAY